MRFGSAVAALAVLLTLPLAAQSDEAMVGWARERIVPIDAEGKAFRALDAELAAVRLIGVGESVHETEPFQSFRFQFLQDLVRRHRVTALVLESGLPEVMAVDDYVRGRTAAVDFKAAMPGYFGELAEAHRTMEWLREWNRGPGKAHPVGVYGSDLPGRAGSILPALDRLGEFLAGDVVVQRLIDTLRPVAVQTRSGWWKGAAQKYEPLPADVKAAFAANVSLLVDRVNHLSRGDRDRLEWSRRLALVIQQSEAALRVGAFSPTIPRDHAMSENTLWVLSRLAPGEKAVYWAHNAHVQKVAAKGPTLPPGSHLAAGTRFDVVLGKEYFAFGTAYGGPSMDKGTPAESGSVDATLEAVGKGPFLVRLRGEPRDAAVDAWLSQERMMRFQSGSLSLPLGGAFDAIAYFDRATPAVRAPAGDGQANAQ